MSSKVKVTDSYDFDGGKVFIPAMTLKRTYEVISTGSRLLDYATGVGGIPLGVIARFWGKHGVGKSSLMYRIAANCWREGRNVLWIDSEKCFSPNRLAKEGVTDEKFVLVNSGEKQEMAIEEVANHCELFLNSKQGKGSIIIIDSLDALSSFKRQEGSPSDRFISDVAYVISNWMKHLPWLLDNRKASCIFINQARADMNQAQTHSDVKVSGGWALEHHSMLTVQLRHIGWLRDSDKVIVGRRINAFIAKSKVADRAWQSVAYDLRNDVGIDNAGEVMELAVNTGVVTYKKPTYTYGEEHWTGASRFRNALLLSNALQTRIIADVEAKIRLPEAHNLTSRLEDSPEEVGEATQEEIDAYDNST